MNLTLEKVRPLLTQPLLPPQEQTVTLWLAAVSAILTGRYGDKLTTEHEPVALVIVADAISRKLNSDRAPGVVSMSVGAARVQYTNEAANAQGWFLSGELAELDNLCGRSSTHSVSLTSNFRVRPVDRWEMP